MVGAYERAKKALELMYDDRCTVIGRVKRKDYKSKETRFYEKAIIKSEPCRLSFLSFPATDTGNRAPALAQSVRLFISPDVTIPPGSKVVVTRGGKAHTFSNSGEPARYPTHQEINLELFKEWA